MTAAAHQPKPEGYYGLERRDVVDELPRPIGRVLDVGCGEGGVGRSLRDAGATEIWGIEVDPEVAETARRWLDVVLASPVEEAVASGELRGPFDTVCCYDVLEHLVDPGSVLRSLRELASAGTRLHISIPNARHFTLLYDLAVRGTFGYAEFGHRDAARLRWVTRRDLVELVQDGGWQVDWVRAPIFRGRDRHVDRLTRGRAREFIALQWHLLAHRA